MSRKYLLGATSEELKVGTKVYDKKNNRTGVVTRAVGGWDFFAKWGDGSGSSFNADEVSVVSTATASSASNAASSGGHATFGAIGGGVGGLIGLLAWKRHRIWGGVLGSVVGSIGEIIVRLTMGK